MMIFNRRTPLLDFILGKTSKGTKDRTKAHKGQKVKAGAKQRK
jgi:hypothetical protein